MKTENRSQKTILLSSLHFLNHELPSFLPVLILISQISIDIIKSIGQSFSAFGASSLQHLSAVGCCHSLSESVFFFALSFFRLICSKHFAAPPFVCIRLPCQRLFLPRK